MKLNDDRKHMQIIFDQLDPPKMFIKINYPYKQVSEFSYPPLLVHNYLITNLREGTPLNVFFVLKLKHWKKWAMVLALALFTAVFLWVETNSSFSVFSSKDDPKALLKSGKSEKQLALTFNISWGQEKVYDILDVLTKHDVQATFFVSGEWALRHPDILKEIKEGKHELGSLGYEYKSYLKQELSEVKKDLRRAKNAFNKLGYNTQWLRPPSGHFNDEILKTAENMGYKVIYWSVSPNDWKNPGTKAIVNKVLKDTGGGDIILLHASDAVKQTDKALEEILPALKKKGFEFVTISELVASGKAKSDPVK